MKKGTSKPTPPVVPQKRKPEEEEEEEEEYSEDDGMGERDEYSDEELDTAFGGSDEDMDTRVVDFYDDGEVSLNLPAAAPKKKKLFDSDSENEGGEVRVIKESWLRPKSQEGFDEREAGSDSSDDDITIKRLEEKAKKAAEKKQRIEEEAAADLKEQIERDKREGEEEEESEGEEKEEENLEATAERMEHLHETIQAAVGVLTDWSTRKPKNVPREEFVAKLKGDIIGYFGYTEFLIDLYFHLFTPAEALSHIESNETPRPMTIRVNSLKSTRRQIAQTLINKGVTLEPIKWSKVGLVIYETQTIPIGATPEYLAGHYMLQSAASFLPVMALDPQPDEHVLDMCAAPGGKTTHIAALMKNTGFLQANDKNGARIPSLVANMARMGVRNAIVTQLDGLVIPAESFKFNRVLVDAPCMGLGVIAKDRSIKSSKEQKDMILCIEIQLKLLLAAIDAVDVKSKDPIIVYSTCSISVEENEAIVNKALKKRFIKVVDAGLPFGVEGITSYRGKQFHPSLKMSRRYYPHTHNIDGFFVCKISKLQNGIKTKVLAEAALEKQPSLVLKKNADKLARMEILEDPDRERIDPHKDAHKTTKNKAKHAKKRARLLARRRGEADDDVAPAPTPSKPNKAADGKSGEKGKPLPGAAKADKSGAKTEKGDKSGAKTENGNKSGGKTDKKPVATNQKGSTPGNGKPDSGKFGKAQPPQKRLRGSKQ